jgi:hypothetical protein
MYKKLLLSNICFALIFQFNAPFAYAQLPQAEWDHINQKWIELHSQIEENKNKIQIFESEKAGLENTQNLFWGSSATGQDVTWSPLYGLTLPVLGPFVMTLDWNNPAWLRWNSALQLLVSLIAAVSGTVVYQNQVQRSNSLPLITNAEVNNLSVDLLIGSAIAYAVLAVVPSFIVASHDGVVNSGRTGRMKELADLLEPLKKNQEQLKTLIPLFVDLKEKNLTSAINRAGLLPENELRLVGFDEKRILVWKRVVLEDLLTVFLETEREGDPEQTLLILTSLLKKPYWDLMPKQKAELEARLPALERAAEEARLMREKAEEEQAQRELAESQRVEAAQNREKIYKEAYDFAAKGNYENALSILMNFNWKPEHSQYSIVQQKLKEWRFILYSRLLRDAYNQAGNGQLQNAVDLLKPYLDKWPANHPDYQRAKNKSAEWLALLKKQDKLKWKPSGTANVQGEWLFYVGPKKQKYRAIMKQYGPYSQFIGGYLLNPLGERFDFVQCQNENIQHLSCDCSHLDGDVGDIVFLLREGESCWMAWFGSNKDRSNTPWEFKHGDVFHIRTNQKQATFSGVKIK